MNNFKLTLLVFFIGVCFYTQAQNSYNYKVYYDNPYWGLTVKPVAFYIDWSGGKPHKATTSLGYGIDAQLEIKEMLKVNVLFIKPYSDFFDPKYTGESTVHFSYFELGGQFNFINTISKETVFVAVSSSSSKSGRVTTTITKGFNAPAYIRKTKQVRGGMFRYQTALSLYEDAGNDDEPWATSTNGTILDPFINDMQTNMFVPGFYAGIGMTQNVDLRTNVDDNGRKSRSRENTFYLDVLYGSPNIEDFIGNNNVAYDVTGEGASGFETKSFGWRFGWEFIVKSSFGLGASSKIEVGSRPGLADSKMFILWTMGFTYTFGIKALAGKLPE